MNFIKRQLLLNLLISLGAVVGKNCIKRTLHKKVLPTLPPATVKGKSTIFSNQNSFFKTKSNTEEVKKEEVTQKSTIESKPTKVSQIGVNTAFSSIFLLLLDNISRWYTKFI